MYQRLAEEGDDVVLADSDLFNTRIDPDASLGGNGQSRLFLLIPNLTSFLSYSLNLLEPIE